MKVFSCKGVLLFYTNLIVLFGFLGIFGIFGKLIKNKDFGCVIVQKQYFFRDSLVELDPRNLTAKIGSLSCIVLLRRSAKNLAHYSISVCDFCKDRRKIACFRTKGRQ